MDIWKHLSYPNLVLNYAFSIKSNFPGREGVSPPTHPTEAFNIPSLTNLVTQGVTSSLPVYIQPCTILTPAGRIFFAL